MRWLVYPLLTACLGIVGCGSSSNDAAPPPTTEPEDAGEDAEEELPGAESLKETVARVLPCWHGTIVPAIKSRKRVLVSAHGNSLRALVMHLDRITPAAMERVEIPSGIPLVYRFSADLGPLGREWLD